MNSGSKHDHMRMNVRICTSSSLLLDHSVSADTGSESTASGLVYKESQSARIRRTIADYFRLYRSRKTMTKILTEESRQRIIIQCKKGVIPSQITKDLGITARHVRRLGVDSR